MRKRIHTCWLLVCLFALSSNAWAQTKEAPQHKAGDVEIEVSEAQAPDTGEKIPVDFGTLYVPENRSKPNGKLIGIVFLRFKSTNPNPGSPIIYLEGGPGISGINSALGNMFRLFAALRENADVIIPDQRGSGRSNRLTCPATTLELATVSLTHEAFLKQVRQESSQCSQSLSGKGVDLAAYNTNENADDIDDLRKAVKAPEAKLLAYSYGTHLAAAVLKRHGNNYQRAVMIGSVGPDQLQKLPSGIQEQLVAIADRVRRDPRLNQRIPNLLTLIENVLNKLAAQPVTVEVTSGKDKKKTAITVNKFAMQWLTATFISRRSFIRVLPALYYSLDRGDLSVLAAIISSVATRTPLPATQYTMRCATNISKQRSALLKQEAPASLLGDAVNFPFPEICAEWGVADLGDSFRTPLRSKMPLLFISGTLDANAPPSNVEEMRKYLPGSIHLIVENAEHEDFFLDAPLKAQIRTVVLEFMKGNAPASLQFKASAVDFVPVGG